MDDKESLKALLVVKAAADDSAKYTFPGDKDSSKAAGDQAAMEEAKSPGTVYFEGHLHLDPATSVLRRVEEADADDNMEIGHLRMRLAENATEQRTLEEENAALLASQATYQQRINDRHAR